jgi:hypothetical protein
MGALARKLLSEMAMTNRIDRVAFLLLFLNIAMILFGAFSLAWESSRAASQRSVPTNLARVVSDTAPWTSSHKS